MPGKTGSYGIANVQTPANSATTVPKPSENVDYDSDTAALEHNMAMFRESQATNCEEFGFSGNVVEMSTTRPRLTKENIPKASVLSETADIKDKYCVICPKGGWDYDDLETHYDKYHDIFLSDDTTYEQWKDSEQQWKYQPLIFTDSESEEYPVNIGTTSDASNDKSSSKNNANSSGNSSDSSNSGASSDRKQRRKSVS